MRFTRFTTACAVGTVVAGMMPAMTVAQDTAADQSTSMPDADENEGIGVIIVTAQRREQAITDVPLAITAVDGDAFAAAGFDNVEDLVQTVPSLTFGSSSTARGEGLVIRGFGTTSFSDAAEGAVGIVIDGVVLGRQASGLLDLVDVERIEVLRGPQGTLFGKNASAGVISIITKRPTSDFEADFRASYGTYDEIRLGGSVSGPIAGDTLSARLTGFYNTRDGILDQVNPAFPITEVNDENEWGVRGKVLFESAGGAEVLLTGEYQKQDVLCCNWTTRRFATAGPFAALQQAVLGPLIEPGPANREVALTIRSNFQKSETIAGTLDASIPLGNHTLHSITGYRTFDISEGNKTDQLPISFFDLAGTDSEIEQISSELQLLSPDDGPFQYVLGAFVFNLQVDSIQRQEASFVRPAPGVNIPAPLAPFLLTPELLALFPPTTLVNIQNQNQETWNYALFGQGTYDLTDRFSITAGARLIREELDVFFDRTGGLPLGAFGQRIDGISDNTSDTALTYMGSLQYDLTPAVTGYFTYSRGYKGQAYDLNAGSPIAFDTTGNAIYEALDPEDVDHFELGLRGSTSDRKLYVSANLFRTQVQNYQAASQRTDGIPGFVLSNVGKFRTQGFELEWTVRPARIFEAGGNFAYVDARYVDFPKGECPPPTLPNRPASCAATGTQDLSGARAANAPEFSGYAYAQFELPVGSSGWESRLRGDLSYRSDTLFSLTQDPNTIQDGYVIANARATLASPGSRYEVALWGRNLFDVDYAETIFSTPVLGGYSQFQAIDRQLGVELRVRFD